MVLSQKPVIRDNYFFPFLILSNYIFQLKRMKFKSEYRWLLFILIPFVILLLIQIVSPLMLLLNSQPIAISSYTTRNIESLNTVSRSYIFQKTQQFTNIFKIYASFTHTLASMLLNNKIYLNFSSNTTGQINNANQYYQNNQSNATQNSNRSMWFATNQLNLSKLDGQQQSMVENYYEIQPYLIASISSKALKQTVKGVSFSYNQNDSEMAFHYPTYAEPLYSQLNSTIITQPFDLFNDTKNTYIITTTPYFSDFLNDTISLCQVLKNNTQNIGVVCVQIRLSALLKHPLTKFQILSQKGIDYKIQLIQPRNNSKVIAQGRQNSTQFIINYPSNTFTTYDTSWAAKACNQGLNTPSSFAVKRDGDQLLNLAAICVNHPSSEPQTPVLLYALIMKSNNLSTHLIESYTYSDVVKTLLIPIMVSILVSILISVVVLRYILNDLDLQLFKINEYCKFIVDGDTTVQIPQFIGTQDIIQIYEEVRIINKLFRYTSKDYFIGYYSNKILKYIQAIHVFKKLNYDLSFLYQNIGDAYLYIEEYEKAISYLEQSIQVVENDIVEQYGSLEKVMQMKLEKEIRFSTNYKQNQIIMTRRLWKIFFIYMKYVELGNLNSKNFFGQNLSEEEKKVKKDKYYAQFVKYATKLKQLLFPDFGSFAQGPLMFQFQAKFHFSCKNFEAGKSCLEKALKYSAIYSKEYEHIGNKIKQKGSNNKFFFKKNKMSGHSRCKPEIIKAFGKNIEAIMKLFNPKSKDYVGAFNYLTDALKSNYISPNVNFLIVSQIKKLLGELKIGIGRFQHTLIFREMMPYKTLHYGPITPDIEPLLYRLPKSVAEVELRQFVFMYDTASLQYHSAYCQRHIAYMKERSDYIFDKLIKKIDRISITKFNNMTDIETGCNLTLKDFNEQILKKTYSDYLKEDCFKGKTWLINGLTKIIGRIKKLQCQKGIIVFLRPIQSFINDMAAKKLRLKSKDKLKKSSLGKIDQEYLSEKVSQETVFPEVGQKIIELMREEGMRNCKLVLMCSVMDEIGQVIKIFGLKDINQRIWATTEGLNKSNNVVYIIDDKHKVDIERIYVSKLTNYADNHVFVF